MRILLFDIDGVLVRPLGYRRGVSTLLKEYATKWNFQGRLAGEEEIALLESVQITSEWDQIPILLACLLEAGLSRRPIQADFSLDCVPTDLFSGFLQDDAPDYRGMILSVGALPRDGKDIASWLMATDLAFPNLFTCRAYGELFAYTRDVRRSQITRNFQLLVLGSRAFRATYRLPASHETEGLLLTCDCTLISAQSAAGLLRRQAQGQMHMAAITARPSLPEALADDEQLDYSPEARMALQVAGLGEMPCIGFGELSWLAGRLQRHADHLLKPNRVHALAGIAAACGLDGLAAVQTAYRIDQPGPEARNAASFLKNDTELLEVHVFEDTPVGVRSVQAAVERLNALGIPAVARAWGVTQNQDKSLALAAMGAEVFPTIAAALAAVLRGWEG